MYMLLKIPSSPTPLSCCHIFGQSYVVVPHVVHGTTSKVLPSESQRIFGLRLLHEILEKHRVGVNFV